MLGWRGAASCSTIYSTTTTYSLLTVAEENFICDQRSTFIISNSGTGPSPLMYMHMLTREKMGFEKYVRMVGSMRGVISFLYNYLLTNTHSAQPRYMSMWEGILQGDIQDREWTALWSDISKFIDSLELREAHLKP